MDKEIALLNQLILSGGSCQTAIVMGEHADSTADWIRQHTGGRVVVVATSAQTAGNSMSQPGCRTVVAHRLSAADVEDADLVVIRPTGFEGNGVIRERIHDAHSLLRPGGVLLLVTHRRRGAASVESMIGDTFGGTEAVRLHGGTLILRATRQDGLSPTGDAPSLEFEDVVSGVAVTMQTRPGVFSRTRVDPGSRLLLDTIPLAHERRLLDLGCGYGLIGIVLAKRVPEAEVTLVDIDAASVALARENCLRNGVGQRTRVLLSDGFDALEGARPFDLVVSHFPLHIPLPDFHRLVAGCWSHLKVGGRLCGVALSAYDVRPSLERFFGETEVIATSDPSIDPSTYHVISAVKTCSIP